MKTQTAETLSELRDFVTTQAAEDAVLESDERLYQAELVKDVLSQESLKPKIIEELVADYSAGVASHLEADKVAA
jgi:hypothetical protein